MFMKIIARMLQTFHGKIEINVFFILMQKLSKSMDSVFILFKDLFI